MLSKDEKNAVLEMWTYKDSRKTKEGRRGKVFAISKVMFRKAYFGNNPTERKTMISEFYSKVGDNSVKTRMETILKMGKNQTLKDVNYNL